MALAKKKPPRKLDGKTLRYLGLIAGLLGLLYLNGFRPERPPAGAIEDEKGQAAAPGLSQQAEESAGESREASSAAPATGAGPSEPWLEALWQPDESAVSQFLAGGADVNAALDRRQTRALHLLFFGSGCEYGASTADVMPVLELLLERGAEVNAADGRGNTPLMLAAAECDPPVVRRLLAAGADMAAINLLGLTAFELTLSNASPAGLVLTEAGFRLPPERYQE